MGPCAPTRQTTTVEKLAKEGGWAGEGRKGLTNKKRGKRAGREGNAVKEVGEERNGDQEKRREDAKIIQEAGRREGVNDSGKNIRHVTGGKINVPERKRDLNHGITRRKGERNRASRNEEGWNSTRE